MLIYLITKNEYCSTCSLDGILFGLVLLGLLKTFVEVIGSLDLISVKVKESMGLTWLEELAID